jgi:hypothetical protein
MVSPLVVTDTTGPRVLLNIDQKVGPRCPNKADDVQLVQLGYVAILQNPRNKSLISAELRAALQKVRPDAPYTGSPSDPLSIAILLHEANRGGPADGHVSVMKNAMNYEPRHSFIMTAINNSLYQVMPADFPRVDKHPKCQSKLRASILNIFGGSVR